MTGTRPVDAGLFVEGSLPVEDGPAVEDSTRPRLLGSTCTHCGTTTFPRQASCPRCTRSSMTDRLLPRRGTLWSFTVQRFRPKPPYAGPEEFTPYGVGYVDLDGVVIVEAILTENDPRALSIGQAMDLVLLPVHRDADGTEVITYGFAPAGAPSGEPSCRPEGA
ncbi:MAG: Zn-ribbon domain-containing OB-fold protein [Frankia sp.]